MDLKLSFSKDIMEYILKVKFKIKSQIFFTLYRALSLSLALMTKTEQSEVPGQIENPKRN